jgi:hypothetical protein
VRRSAPRALDGAVAGSLSGGVMGPLTVPCPYVTRAPGAGLLGRRTALVLPPLGLFGSLAVSWRVPRPVDATGGAL